MAAYGPTDAFANGLNQSVRPARQMHSMRQPPRSYDAPYGTMNSSRFGGDMSTTGSMRYDAAREAFNQGGMNPPPVGNPAFPFDMNTAHTWNGPPAAQMQGFGMNGMDSFGGPRNLRPARARADMQGIYEQPMNSANSPNMPSYNAPNALNSILPRSTADGEEELIPTAIVIKNIPFAVKKEQLQMVMTEMNLPLPYAFNYHFDNGVFRGLAFANFTSADETGMVIRALNHFEINGRKLRVEYKKMLPVYERERIEREKRERRGQLEEQHRPLNPSALQTQISLSSLNSNTLHRSTPSPLQMQNKPEVDMNDTANMEFYERILVFKNNPNQEVLIFPASLSPAERRAVHVLAHRAGLHHSSRGVGEQRQVHIVRSPNPSNQSPPSATMPDAFQGNEHYPRPFARSSTTELRDGRYEMPPPNLRGQASVGLLEVDTNNGFGRTDANLRSAKSFHELRRWGTSPVSSIASYTGANTSSRLQSLNDTEATNTPALTPTASSNSHGLSNDENFLINGVSSMNMNSAATQQTSPPRRGRFTFATWDDQPTYTAPAPIGSNRTVSVNADNASQERAPIRQPRGAGPDRAPGFRRQNGRGSGSDELRNAQAAIAE